MKARKYLILALVVLVFLVLTGYLCWKPDYVYNKKTEEFRQKLADIIRNRPENERMEHLRELAIEVGAGTVRTEIAAVAPYGESGTVSYQNSISESELVQNIHNALQTRTMIAMCKTASKQFVIALIAAVIALVSAVAACFATLKRDKISTSSAQKKS